MILSIMTDSAKQREAMTEDSSLKGRESRVTSPVGHLSKMEISAVIRCQSFLQGAVDVFGWFRH
jgi:hypothetical protein